MELFSVSRQHELYLARNVRGPCDGRGTGKFREVFIASTNDWCLGIRFSGGCGSACVWTVATAQEQAKMYPSTAQPVQDPSSKYPKPLHTFIKQPGLDTVEFRQR